MAFPGRIRGRLALAIVLTALIPVIVAILLAEDMIRQTGARFFVPEIGARLDQSLELYQELARAVKGSMRYQAGAIAENQALRQAVATGDRALLDAQLRSLLGRYPGLVSLRIKDGDGNELASVDRGRPLDPAKENGLEVVRPVGDASTDSPPAADRDDAAGPELVAVFATPRARFDQRDEMSQFVDTYRKIAARRQADEAGYVKEFAALLGVTILAAMGVGILLARGVSRRIVGLAHATHRVGAGDLKTRVPEQGSDEISDLARAFNRMLGEVETSRARVEYLRRIGAWQEMARRLAHEIKNPLTPIQLAVQEIHRRYPGSDQEYRKVLDSTLEIVEDEVGTLRRLVTEFSGFARLPQAELKEADLGEFLREQSGHRWLPDAEVEDGETPELPGRVTLSWVVPDGEVPAYLDRHMLRRALINLLENAAQAIGQSGKSGRIRAALEREGNYHVLRIDDDGPGIPEDLRDAIFDPYVTTKSDGTGLGLAIAKKIVVEHGGSIVALPSPWGGARLELRLPAAGTPAGRAALEARDAQPVSTRLGSGRQPGWQK
jgi:two-component system, NtrC family, nitrogen regulation sensor histidine kinase NtrY